MVKNIITSISEGNYSEAKKAFDQEISERVATLIDEKKANIFAEASETDEGEGEGEETNEDEELDEAARRPKPPKLRPDTIGDAMKASRDAKNKKAAEKRAATIYNKKSLSAGQK